MRKVLALLAMLAIVGLVSVPAAAQLNTLYGQEGTAADGYTAIDASGQGPATNPNSTNWKYQYGSGAWSGVYSWDTNAWVETTGDAEDPHLEIECDIEMFCSQTYAGNKIYFHIGNLYSATADDLTAHMTGTATYNNGQWLGICFDGTSKVEGDFDLATGRITDAMIGTVDIGGRDISAEAFDVTITLSYSGTGSATDQVPDTFGEGAHGTIEKTLWWLVNGGAPGSYNLDWKIQLHPDEHQPDGNYHLDPVIVAAPVL